MPQLRCPTCGRFFEREKTPAMPFCSERCRLIDLGRWLDEGYSLEQKPQMLSDDEDYPVDDG